MNLRTRICELFEIEVPIVQTGMGWVAERPGDYADALSKGHAVQMFGCESTGALFHAFAAHLRVLRGHHWQLMD